MEDHKLREERGMEIRGFCFTVNNVPSPLSGMMEITVGAVYEILYYQCLTPSNNLDKRIRQK
jgi:hypothetical protein